MYPPTKIAGGSARVHTTAELRLLGLTASGIVDRASERWRGDAEPKITRGVHIQRKPLVGSRYKSL